MESRSVAAIRYLDAQELYKWLKAGHSASNEPFQVVDVRGSDYIGGHIAKGWNYPYRQLRDDLDKCNELRGRLDEERGSFGVINCVFHCALSQQRGPSAAMKFLRTLSDDDLSRFRIYVLRGGFSHWQSLYGENQDVTESYKKDLWM
ncbi:LANO_0E16028g1_1 [Lachancea nothofagi CBS 11611]|uniref:LANO_0E16028g1_1 n=1 Tax=Lachancea nothofagi CBS 11611 TaxID=1266666 RepID=A0A1G4K1K8_9SACH|nr:LANO_0E16028g1_1 [Lachancea nothofagi CBS 11611]